MDAISCHQYDEARGPSGASVTMKVLVIGAGKMVGAILHGLKGAQDLSQFYLYSPSGESAKSLASQVGANWIKHPLDVQDFDYVLLGHKPQQLPDVAATFGPHLSKSVILSLLAAVSEEQQRKLLEAPRLIRVMPNLPVKIRKGVTLLTSQSAVKELPIVQSLFSTLGEVFTLNENAFEELTLLTGSGPAFYYEFTQNLASSFSSLSDGEREKMARAVFLGAALSAQTERLPLQQMVADVTSKAGVTIAVLKKWRELDLGTILKKGVARGLARTQEIKDSLLRN